MRAFMDAVRSLLNEDMADPFSVMPAPQRWLDPKHREFKAGLGDFVKGGRYLAMPQKEDLTDRVAAGGVISVAGGRPSFKVSKTEAARPTRADGRLVKTNLFKQKAGWRWVSEAPPETATIVSVVTGGQHLYALTVTFAGSVILARYAEAPSEPRLRPTTYGSTSVGSPVGEINIRGALHPVYDQITIT